MKLIRRNLDHIRFLSVLFFSGLVLYAIWIDFDNLPKIETVNRNNLIWSLLCYLAYLSIVSYRTLIMLNELNEKDIKYIDWFMLNIKGRFINKIIPQGGNVYKGVTLKKLENVSYKKYISYLGIFSWVDIITNFLICLILLLLLDQNLNLAGHRATTVIFLLLLVISISPLIFKKIIRGVEPKSRIFKNLKIITSDNIINSFEKLTVVGLSKVIILGAISILITVGLYYFIFSFLDLYPDFSILSLYVCFMRISTIVQLTPGNIGLQELMLGALTELTGGTLLVGITVSLIIRILTYITLGALTLIFKFQSS